MKINCSINQLLRIGFRFFPDDLYSNVSNLVFICSGKWYQLAFKAQKWISQRWKGTNDQATSQWPKNNSKAIKRWDDEDALWKPRQPREGLGKRIQKLVGNQCIGW